MQEFEKIAPLENEIESLSLDRELKERNIPHALRSYHDTAYDGIYQLTAGWGYVEAPAKYKSEILLILSAIRQG